MYSTQVPSPTSNVDAQRVAAVATAQTLRMQEDAALQFAGALGRAASRVEFHLCGTQALPGMESFTDGVPGALWTTPAAPALIEGAIPAPSEASPAKSGDDHAQGSGNSGGGGTELKKLLPTALNARYTFEEFVIGECNEFAHAVALAVAGTPARVYNPLVLHGGVGVGKTHLMQAIGHRLAEADANATIVYVTCESFSNEFAAAVRANRTAEFRQRYRTVDALLVDDIQFLAKNEAAHEEFCHTVNALHADGRQVVVALDRTLSEIGTLEPQLVSRFEGGLQAAMLNPNGETREKILRKKLESERVNIPDDVLALIANVGVPSVRELEGALKRVMAFATLQRAPLTLSIAAEALKGYVTRTAPIRVTIPKIKEVVATAFGLTVREMDNGRREQRLAGPRQIAMFISTALTTYSLPQIAREFGKKDHTTVMYARDRIKEQMQRDEAYRGRVNRLIAVCEGR